MSKPQLCDSATARSLFSSAGCSSHCAGRINLDIVVGSHTFWCWAKVSTEFIVLWFWILTFSSIIVKQSFLKLTTEHEELASITMFIPFRVYVIDRHGCFRDLKWTTIRSFVSEAMWHVKVPGTHRTETTFVCHVWHCLALRHQSIISTSLPSKVSSHYL